MGITKFVTNVELARIHVQALSILQENAFQDLLDLRKLSESGKDFLFDYIFNETENPTSFESYLKKRGKKLADVL